VNKEHTEALRICISLAAMISRHSEMKYALPDLRSGASNIEIESAGVLDRMLRDHRELAEELKKMKP